LGKIAKKYRTSIKSIARANRIHRRNYIVAGQKLKIPRSGVVVYKTKTYKKTKKVPTITHVVKGGDSLWNIAKRYGTTTKQIQHYNSLKNSRLIIGQVLKVPKTKSEITPKEALKTYRVRRGDSPFRIAKTHNMELERFLRINRLTPRSKIYPGQNMFVE
jgi:membrane-bound lytic murein transglycosylase D